MKIILLRLQQPVGRLIIRPSYFRGRRVKGGHKDYRMRYICRCDKTYEQYNLGQRCPTCGRLIYPFSEHQYIRIGRDFIQLLPPHMRPSGIYIHPLDALYDTLLLLIQKGEQPKHLEYVKERHKAMLLGKGGHIRGRMLGKRQIFSGRAVIVPDPTLKPWEIKLPKRLANLWLPYIRKKYGIFIDDIST